MESINQITTGELLSLSVQELIDCDGYFNYGCNGGFMNMAFKYIMEKGGTETDKYYPYTDIHRSPCRTTKVLFLKNIIVLLCFQFCNYLFLLSFFRLKTLVLLPSMVMKMFLEAIRCL